VAFGGVCPPPSVPDGCIWKLEQPSDAQMSSCGVNYAVSQVLNDLQIMETRKRSSSKVVMLCALNGE